MRLSLLLLAVSAATHVGHHAHHLLPHGFSLGALDSLPAGWFDWLQAGVATAALAGPGAMLWVYHSVREYKDLCDVNMKNRRYLHLRPGGRCFFIVDDSGRRAYLGDFLVARDKHGPMDYKSWYLWKMIAGTPT